MRPDEWSTTILEEAERAIATGCNDPLIAYVRVRMLGDVNARNISRDQADLQLIPVVDSLRQQGYPTERIWLAAKNAHSGLAELDPDNPLTPLMLEQAIKSCIKALQQADGFERRVYAQWIAQWADDLKKHDLITLIDAIERADGIETWLYHTALGTAYVERAWQDRGSGFADTVNEQQWNAFHEQLSIARGHLAKAWTKDPTLPEAPTQMITVAMGASIGSAEIEMRQWFDRAVQAQFDYEPAYRGYEWGIRPRWHGSFEALESFGRECFDTGRFDTAIPWRYILCIEAIRIDLARSDPDRRWDYDKQPRVYEDHARVLEGYLGKAPYGFTNNCLVERQIAYAYAAERYDEVVRLIGGLSHTPTGLDTVTKVAWEDIAGEAFAQSSPLAQRIQTASNQVQNQRFDQALQVYHGLLQENTHPLLHKYLANRAITLDWYQHFHQNKVVQLQPDKILSGWQPMQGAWSVDEDGSLIGDAQGGYLQIRLFGDFGTRWELSGRARVIEAPTDSRRPLVVVAGWSRSTPLGIIFDIARSETSVGELSRNRMLANVDGLDDDFTFSIRFTDGHATIKIDDNVVLTNAYFGWFDADDDNRLGLGGYYWDHTHQARIAFSDLNLRKVR
ncbi:MAG: hypothetical protein RIG82_09225 [Phycisphaeraceae bacterium]